MHKEARSSGWLVNSSKKKKRHIQPTMWGGWAVVVLLVHMKFRKP